MKICGITYPDVNNGTGFRVTLWVSGCIHHCNGCHNKETWDFDYGREFTDTDKEEIFRQLDNKTIKGLTLSGGDPICSYEDVLCFVKEVKDKYKDKDIWLFTGFTKEYLELHNKEILEYLDFIVDGPYIESERDLSLAFRGSRNQRIWHKSDDGTFIEVNDDYFRPNSL